MKARGEGRAEEDEGIKTKEVGGVTRYGDP
jgi:hypothetical protein